MAKRCARVLILLISILISGPLAVAQKKNEEPVKKEPAFALTFSDITASREGGAALPGFFTRQPGAPNLSELRVHLTYPKSELKYENYQASEPARNARLAIKAKELESIEGQAAGLEIVFALTDPAENSFPSGQLATIHFQIPDPVPGVSVRVRAALWIDGRPVTGENSRAHVEEAFIEVPLIPVFLNCFFFTH